MKAKNLFLLAVLVMTLTLASCCKKVPDYARLLPDDADVVARIDVRQIAAKSGFGKEGTGLAKKMETTLKERVSERTWKKLSLIMKAPAQAGLDLRDPVLVYLHKDRQEMGLAGTIYKADRVADLLNTFAAEFGCATVSRTGDLRYINLRGILFVFNDDWFFVTSQSPDLTPKEQATAIEKRYEKAKNALFENKAFQRMFEKEGIAQAFVKGKWLSSIERLAGVDVSATDAVFDLAVDRAEARAMVELVASTERGEQQTETIDRLMGGKKSGLKVRLGFDMLNKLAQSHPAYDSYVASMVGQLIKYVELKYEGDARLVLRIVTCDIAKTPIETALAVLHKELGI